jgi:hypothetical protein
LPRSLLAQSSAVPRALRLLLPLALLLAPPASAHGPFGPARGYVSSVTSVKPNVLGLEARVVGDQLVVRNWSTKQVIIFASDGSQYLRLDRRGVFANAGFGWKRVSSGTSYGWHDARVRWVGRKPPEVVAREPDEAHFIRSWRVPGTAGGKRFVIRGLLGYAPHAVAAKGDAFPWKPWAVGALVALAVAGLGFVAVRSRSRPVRAGSGSATSTEKR